MSDKDYLNIKDNLVGEDDMLRSPPGSISMKSLVESVSEKPIIQVVTTTTPPSSDVSDKENLMPETDILASSHSSVSPSDVSEKDMDLVSPSDVSGIKNLMSGTDIPSLSISSMSKKPLLNEGLTITTLPSDVPDRKQKIVKLEPPKNTDTPKRRNSTTNKKQQTTTTKNKKTNNNKQKTKTKNQQYTTTQKNTIPSYFMKTVGETDNNDSSSSEVRISDVAGKDSASMEFGKFIFEPDKQVDLCRLENKKITKSFP